MIKKTMNQLFQLFICFCMVLNLSQFALAQEKTEDAPLEIEIETTVKASALEKFLVTTSVIEDEEIQELPVNNTEDLLKNLNGVISLGTANKKGKADIGIRGFGMNYIRVFIDGVPLNTANDRTVDFSLIPLEYIERIEVIKGPAPVTYGSDSIGGIINIVTKSGRENQGEFLKVTGGNFGIFEATGVAGGGSENFGYFTMVKKSSTSGYRAHAAENFLDVFLKTDYDFDKNNNVSFMFFNTTGDREAPNAQNPDGSLRLQQSGFYMNSYDWEYNDILQQGFNLKFEGKPEKRIGYFANLYYKKYNDTLRAYVAPGTQVKPPPGSPFQYYRPGAWNYSYWNSYTLGGDARLIVPVSKHKITLGASMERDYFRDTYLGRSKPGNPQGSLSMPMEQWDRNYWNPWENLRYNSLYIQDEIELTKNLAFTVGLRNDSFSRSASSLNGIGNLVYVNGNDTFRATVGKTGRFPTLKELEGKGGNPNLKPERAWNYEIGYRHNEPKFVDYEISLYQSSINNLIQPKDPTDGFSMKENISLVKIFGAEANVIRSWDNFEGRVGYTYINRVSPPLTPDWEEVPRHKGVLGLTYHKEGNLCWSAQGVFIGQKKTGDKTISTIPGYALANVRLAYPSFGDMENRNWYFETTITNLFDADYQNRLYFPAPGRTITGSIKYRF
ncbi:MAG: TonB-dependent receptor plug domain-containing protein [Vulcanimicrobiota bacterium]